MSIPDERPHRPSDRPTGKSFKGLMIVIAAPISIILLWIAMVKLLPLILK
jgi:hypothetical protein